MPNVLQFKNSAECRDFLDKHKRVPVLMVFYDSMAEDCRSTLAALEGVAWKVRDRAIIARADVRADPRFNEIDIGYTLPEAHVIINGWVVNRLHGAQGQATLVDALRTPWSA